MKGLTSTCIDESLINQGVDQIKLSSEGGTRRSGPTIIEKICATVESLLGYQYIAVWDTSFMVVSTMFDKLGMFVFYFFNIYSLCRSCFLILCFYGMKKQSDVFLQVISKK